MINYATEVHRHRAQNAQLLNEQSIKLSTTGRTMVKHILACPWSLMLTTSQHDATLQLQELSHSIHSFEKKQDRRVEDLKVDIRGRLQDLIMDKLKSVDCSQ